MTLFKSQTGITPGIIVIIVGLAAVLAGSTFYLSRKDTIHPTSAITSQATSPGIPASHTPQSVSIASPAPQRNKLEYDVPFTAQSPFAEWKDPRQQDACEEASVMMAMYWVKGEKIASKEAAKQEILAISTYQEDNFGEYRDTSAKDTAKWLLGGYYQHTNYDIKPVTGPDNIIAELDAGYLVIIPANGQALKNKNFTQPGPERHMLVIKGYDRTKHHFITNEPGIRQGEDWKYDMDLLFSAIRDYETGYHVPITGEEKVMIVVKR